MPRVRTSKTHPPPGFERIEPTLQEFEQKMRDGLRAFHAFFELALANAEPHEGKRKVEAVWPILKINHERTRYIYDLFYRKRELSREVYDFCLREGYADAGLIAKWKKSGYEKLCCLRCIQTRDSNFGGTCICRVPKDKLEPGTVVECCNCGCRGCASCDT